MSPRSKRPGARLDDLVCAGKILYPAISNFSAWQGMQAVSLCESRGWARPVCFQPMYNLAKRQAEVEILPMCQSAGLGVMPYSPTGGGLLTGKYAADVRPQTGRLLDNTMYGVRYADPGNYQLAGDFTALAQRYGHEPAALADCLGGGASRGYGTHYWNAFGGPPRCRPHVHRHRIGLRLRALSRDLRSLGHTSAGHRSQRGKLVAQLRIALADRASGSR